MGKEAVIPSPGPGDSNPGEWRRRGRHVTSM